MDLFTLSAKLKMDSSDFDRGMKAAEESGGGLAGKLEKSFDTAKKAFKAVVSVAAVKTAVSAFVGLTNSAAAAGDTIDKQSQALGMSRKAYQEWDYILSQSGASIDSMGTSMKTLNAAIMDGGKDSKAALAQLGLSFRDLQMMNQEQQFEAVVQAFQKMPEGATKSALAVKLFGRNGQELLPLLNSSAESIEELRKKAHELGLVMSDEDVNAAVAYTDAMDTMNRTFTAFKNRLASQIMPAITKAMEDLTAYAGKLREAFEKEGLAGVFQTIVDDIKNIQWPTWDDVWQAAQAAWETIKSGAATLGGLVFGNAQDIIDGAANLYTNIASAIEGIDWGNLGGTIWGLIKGAFGGVVDFFKQIFGESKDGVAGLDWSGLGTSIVQYILAAFNGIGGLVKGFFESAWMDVKDIIGWEDLKKKWEEAGAELDQYIFQPVRDFYNNEIKPIFDWIAQAIQDVMSFFGVNTDLDEKSAKGKEIYEDIDSIYRSGRVKEARDKYGADVFDAYMKGEYAKAMSGTDAIDPTTLNAIYEEIGNISGAFDETTQSAEDSKAAIAAVGEAIHSLPSEKTIVINTLTNNAGYMPHATGLGYVPFDNYRALLHRGERVLTASQNADYSRGGAQQGVDMSALTNGIVNAMHQAMRGIDIRAHVVQHELTESVNRAMSADVKARRFAK